MPEVTLPVVPGMEGCHWPLRKAKPEDHAKIVRMLLGGQPVRAKDAVGWLIDFAGPMDAALKTVWQLASNGDHGIVAGGDSREELGPLDRGPTGRAGNRW